MRATKWETRLQCLHKPMSALGLLLFDPILVCPSCETNIKHSLGLMWTYIYMTVCYLEMVDDNPSAQDVNKVGMLWCHGHLDPLTAQGQVALLHMNVSSTAICNTNTTIDPLSVQNNKSKVEKLHSLHAYPSNHCYVPVGQCYLCSVNKLYETGVANRQ